MKLRFPLYAKILLWFFLNLVLLGVVFYAFFKIQFRFGFDSLLAGAAGERVQSVSEVITAELRETKREQWDDVLKRFSSAYRIQFYLFKMDGGQIAGEKVEAPPAVLAKFVERPGPPPGQPFRRATMPNRPRQEFSPERQPDEPQHAEPPEQAFEGQRPIGPQSIRAPNFYPPRFMQHTTNPNRYWVGVRLRLMDQHTDRNRSRPDERNVPAPRPFTLLAVSDSLSGGGLFFDFTPWILVGCGVVVISVLFWLPFARSITRSISQMTHATEEIAAGRFETRVNANRKDELGRLSDAINRMASRLAGFVSGQKRFLGDTAHELCSPIARIQVALGILEQRADEKQKVYVEDVREEMQQMTVLVNELLSFSKASLEPAAIKLQPVELRAIVEQAVKREANEISNLKLEIENEIRVLADPELLLRSLANLIRNAVRYAGSAGPITISARRENNLVVISIADCGPGVPETSLAQIFDPFYRPEPSRDRESGGVGLGLSIVKTCIESCGGKVSCRNRQPKGFEVSIQLTGDRSADGSSARVPPR